MAQKRKSVNPQRVPRTQADVDRAFRYGLDFGCEFALNFVLLVLKDKHDAPDEDVYQLRDEFMELVQSYNMGYITYADVKRTLYGDYDFKVHLEDKGGHHY